jgi:hypothetical protein
LTISAVVTPLSIETTSVPNAILEQPYPTTRIIGCGGTKFSKVGRLPRGLRFDRATGSISGTAEQLGSFSFSVKLKSNTKPVQTVTQSFSITVTQ